MTPTEFPNSPIYALTLALGLLFGSFLNVVIHRGPSLWGLQDGEKRGDLLSPRSYCPQCKTPIPAWRLAPLLSFLLQRGRCAACAAPIPLRYPAVEALGAAVALAAVATFGAGIAALTAAVFGLALIALAAIDLETGYLPDAIALPLLLGGFAANAFGLFVPLTDAAIGAAGGYLVFRLIAFAFEKLRGKEGLGQGDAKLLAAIGAWGGWEILPFVVFVGAAGTLIAVIAIRLRRRAAHLFPAGRGRASRSEVRVRGNGELLTDVAPSSGVSRHLLPDGEKEERERDQPIPFGPALCAAGFVVFLLASRFTGL